jgi:hypothetical protein
MHAREARRDLAEDPAGSSIALKPPLSCFESLIATLAHRTTGNLNWRGWHASATLSLTVFHLDGAVHKAQDHELSQSCLNRPMIIWCHTPFFSHVRRIEPLKRQL